MCVTGGYGRLLCKATFKQYLKEVREYSMRVIWERSIPGRVSIKYKALRQESIGEVMWSKHKRESWEA